MVLFCIKVTSKVTVHILSCMASDAQQKVACLYVSQHRSDLAEKHPALKAMCSSS